MARLFVLLVILSVACAARPHPDTWTMLASGTPESGLGALRPRDWAAVVGIAVGGALALAVLITVVCCCIGVRRIRARHARVYEPDPADAGLARPAWLDVPVQRAVSQPEPDPAPAPTYARSHRWPGLPPSPRSQPPSPAASRSRLFLLDSLPPSPATYPRPLPRSQPSTQPSSPRSLSQASSLLSHSQPVTPLTLSPAASSSHLLLSPVSPITPPADVRRARSRDFGKPVRSPSSRSVPPSPAESWNRLLLALPSPPPPAAHPPA